MSAIEDGYCPIVVVVFAVIGINSLEGLAVKSDVLAYHICVLGVKSNSDKHGAVSIYGHSVVVKKVEKNLILGIVNRFIERDAVRGYNAHIVANGYVRTNESVVSFLGSKVALCESSGNGGFYCFLSRYVEGVSLTCQNVGGCLVEGKIGVCRSEGNVTGSGSSEGVVVRLTCCNVYVQGIAKSEFLGLLGGAKGNISLCLDGVFTSGSILSGCLNLYVVDGSGPHHIGKSVTAVCICGKRGSVGSLNAYNGKVSTCEGIETALIYSKVNGCACELLGYKLEGCFITCFDLDLGINSLIRIVGVSNSELTCFEASEMKVGNLVCLKVDRECRAFHVVVHINIETVLTVRRLNKVRIPCNGKSCGNGEGVPACYGSLEGVLVVGVTGSYGSGEFTVSRRGSDIVCRCNLSILNVDSYDSEVAARCGVSHNDCCGAVGGNENYLGSAHAGSGSVSYGEVGGCDAVVAGYGGDNDSENLVAGSCRYGEGVACIESYSIAAGVELRSVTFVSACACSEGDAVNNLLGEVGCVCKTEICRNEACAGCADVSIAIVALTVAVSIGVRCKLGVVICVVVSASTGVLGVTLFLTGSIYSTVGVCVSVSSVDYSGSALSNLLSSVVRANKTGNGNNVTSLNIGCKSVNVKSISFRINDCYGDVFVTGIPSSVYLKNSTLYDNLGVIIESLELRNGYKPSLGEIFVAGDNCSSALSNLSLAAVCSHCTGNGNNVTLFNIRCESVNVKLIAAFILDGYGNVVVTGIPCLIDSNNGTAYGDVAVIGKLESLCNSNYCVYGKLSGEGLNSSLAISVANGSGESVINRGVVRVGKIYGDVACGGAILERDLVAVNCPRYREGSTLESDLLSEVEVRDGFLSVVILIDVIKEACSLFHCGSCGLGVRGSLLLRGVLGIVLIIAEEVACCECTKAKNNDKKES